MSFELAAPEALDPDLLHRAAFARRQRRGEERLRARADHALDDLGNGEGGAVAGQHVAAIAGDGDAIGDGEDLLQPMRDIEHGVAAPAQLPQHGEEPLGLALVQGRVRLVEDEQPRRLQQHAAELDQLLLADAEPADRRLDIDMQAELGQQIAALGRHGGDGDQPVADRLAIDEEIGQDGALRKQAQLLIDDADAELAGGLGGIDGQLLAIEEDAPGIGADHAGQNLHQRGFAGAVLAHHRVDGAGLDLQIHAVEGHHPAVALGKVVDGDERPVRHRPYAWRSRGRRAVIALRPIAKCAYSDSAAMGCMPLGQSLLRTLSDQGL